MRSLIPILLLTLAFASQVSGQPIGESDGKLKVMPTPIAPEDTLEIAKSKINGKVKSPTPPMMPGLPPPLKQGEMLDLPANIRRPESPYV